MKDLFIPILDTTATSEAAMESLREAIFWQIVNNTAHNNRISENDFNHMKRQAEAATSCVAAEFFCESKVETLDFRFGNTIHILQKLFNIIIQYNAWYEEDDECETAVGFAWNYNNHQYRLLFFW